VVRTTIPSDELPDVGNYFGYVATSGHLPIEVGIYATWHITSRRNKYTYTQNGTTSSRLDTAIIFEMLSLPSDIDRADFISKPHSVPSSGEVKTVDEMTVRELREVKQALREAEASRKRAEEDAQVARDTLESIRDIPPRVGPSVRLA